MKKLLLLAALATATTGAFAAPLTYTEAIDAARPLFQKGDYAGAQKLTEEALSLAKTPDEKVGALFRLGETYNQRKLYAQARNQWEKVLQLPEASSDDKLKTHALIGASYNNQGDWSNCISEFQKIVEMPDVAPKDKVVAHLAMAGAFLGAKNDVEARRQLSIVADDTSLDSGTRSLAYTQLGQNLLNARQFEQGRAAFTAARQLPGVAGQLSLASQVSIAQSYADEGNAEKAQTEFLKAQGEALTQVKWFTDRNQLATGRTVMEQMLTFGTVAAPLDAATRVQIGQLLMSEGKPAQARVRFDEVIAKQYGPGLTAKDEAAVRSFKQSAQLFSAKSYAQEGNKVQAQQLLQTLLATEDLNSGVQNGARTLLKELS